MKDKIHPNWEEAIVTCACGASFKSFSTRKVLKVEICSSCHPFYTGKQKLLTGKEGQVEKFRQRVEKAEARKARTAQKAKAAAKEA
jgi:large subunit ribosomal protein L31